MKAAKSRTLKQKIYATSMDGNVIAYTRHYSSRQAQAMVLGSRFATEEASIDDLMAIGRDGATVGGLTPDVDPAQQDLPIP
jgi:hypothetical protein